MIKPIKIFLLAIFLSINLFAQLQKDSLEIIAVEPNRNILSTKFDKQLNTYNLKGGLFYQYDYKKLNLTVKENYNSTFIKSAEKSTRDAQYLTLSGAYDIVPKFSIGLFAGSNILSDNRQIEINQASSSNGFLFLQYKPEENYQIAPFFGFSNNRQIGENDYGYLYGGEGFLRHNESSEFSIVAEGKIKNEDISPRKNTLRNIDAVITNKFTPGVTNFINAGFNQGRKDFYYPADSVTSQQFDIVNNIQSRIETGYTIEDRLLYDNFLDQFLLDLTGRIYWRDIDRNTHFRSLDNPSSSIFDTKINEFKLEFESLTSYTSDFFSGAVKFIYSERDEKHITKRLDGISESFYTERAELESRKNNTTIRAAISFIGNVDFSETDRLTFSLFQNKLRYDTPSLENYDDRDEILSIVRLRYSKKLTPFFEAFVNTEGTLNHTVYLFSEKSSNNNVNRVLSLESGGYYSGKNVTSLNSFKVSANYTVYDFEDLNPNYRSYAFRQFTATDSSTIRLTRRLKFSLYGYLKLSEQGDFNWASFAARPVRYLTEIYSEPKIAIDYENNLEMAVGIRYFSLNTYNYKENEKIIDSRYLSIGPVTEIQFLLNNKLYFRLYGWYEFITINSIDKNEQVNMSLEMNWNF